MKIRKATPSDVPAIFELGRKVTEYAVTDNTVTFWPRAVIERAASAEDVIMLVAGEKDIAGFLIAHYCRGLNKAVIENIYHHPDQKNQDIDDALLKQALKLLQEMGCEFVAAILPRTTEKKLAALYENNGFSKGEESFAWFDKSLADSYAK